jgi:pyruvate dehydrogenase E1 component alpha subunit
MTTTEQMLDDLRSMLRIRLMEEAIRDLRLNGEIVGSVHLCIGQEAGPAGVCSVLQPQDAVLSTYRGHGWALARGVPMTAILAELMGRVTGVNGGRGGSAYFTAPSHGFYGENSIVGAGAPIAVGAALASRYDGSNRVAVTVFGDGAMNQGSVHEAMNFASAFKLPVVFVCENNRWSELTAIDEMVGEPALWKRARAYGMLGHRIDGNDPDSVRSAAAAAAERARRGGGPMLLELMTERLVGHYIGDAEQYRRPGEVEDAMTREPISRITSRLCTERAADHDVARIEAAVAQEVADAVLIARNADPADPSTAKDHVYA